MTDEAEKIEKVYSFLAMSEFKHCCYDELGKVLAFIEMDKEGLYKTTLALGGGSVGLYLTLDQAKTAILTLLN